jgi:hypothetical protein
MCYNDIIIVLVVTEMGWSSDGAGGWMPWRQCQWKWWWRDGVVATIKKITMVVDIVGLLIVNYYKMFYKIKFMICKYFLINKLNLKIDYKLFMLTNFSIKYSMLINILVLNILEKINIKLINYIINLYQSLSPREKFLFI